MSVISSERINGMFGLNNNQNSTVQRKVNRIYGKNTFNPFLNKKGELVNKYINYQTVLNNPNISAKAKEYITQATGLTPTATVTVASQKTFQNVTPEIGNVQDTVQTTKAVEPQIYNNISKSDSNIVNAAKKYIGTPYVWGGESKQEGGMDCSGFVYNALRDAGYKVGRTTAQGYRSFGNTVKKSDMQPGDLIFYGSGNKASHIGIYIGGGQVIQSSGGKSNTKSNPGKGVSIKNVDYRNDFLEARRY